MKENSRECRRYIVPYRGKIRRDDREKLLGQRSLVLWFTGLSGSGKSTIAHGVEEALHKMGKLTYPKFVKIFCNILKSLEVGFVFDTTDFIYLIFLIGCRGFSEIPNAL